MSLTVRRPVTVKVRVTEAFQKAMGAQLQDTIRRLDGELAQIDAQLKKAGGDGADRALAQQLGVERDKRVDRRAKVLEDMKELARLSPGAEIVQGTVEGPVEVRVGDDWSRLFSAEIVVEDGKVVEIRER
ncbi:MAG: YlqD family protein [Chloroflexota bacterium]